MDKTISVNSLLAQITDPAQIGYDEVLRLACDSDTLGQLDNGIEALIDGLRKVQYNLLSLKLDSETAIT